ncbi:MAG: hypothetical protein HKN82_18285, partial [Akkermansiaceae bacterium]|nr:hypothetical protein [Akkermansiaceae bacterium]
MQDGVAGICHGSPVKRIRAIIVLPAFVATVAPAGAAVDFEKEILPILEANCIECHGPDKQKSKLRVDQRAVLLRGGDSGLAALVPG